MATITITIDADGVPLSAILEPDETSWRWREENSGADTEISGRTIGEALDAAMAAWPQGVISWIP